MTMLAGPDDEVAFRTMVVSTEPRNSPANILDPAVPHSPRARIKMCAWCKAVFDGNHWLDLDQAVERLDLLLQDELPSIYYGMCETCFAEICGTEVP